MGLGVFTVHSLPLAPFLTALAVDGMHVTLQDYTRISLALQAAGPWTITRLRGARRHLCPAL
jgi:hypothetical protein